MHVHEWVQSSNWKCIADDHCHSEPDILDAATAWHVLGVIRTHTLKDLGVCECGWVGDDYIDHLDDAVFYWLRNYNEAI